MLWLVLAGWGLFVLTWIGLHAWIVPRIGEWRPELERWASSAVGVPVRVGEIRAESGGSGRGWLPPLMPSFELRDVRLFDPRGEVALQLPLIRTAVSVRSLWHGSFEQIVIDQPVLDVRRTEQGRIEVAGLDLSGPQDEDGQAADWFFAQNEFVIRQGTLRWTDDQRRQPTLALDKVDLVVRNTALTHQFRIDATPPPEWGERLSLRGRLREPLIDLQARERRTPWQHWSGEVYADVARIDAERLHAYVDLSDWGIDVQSGHGALRVWADVERGRFAGLTADLSLREVQTRLGPELPVLGIDNLQGRVAATWGDDGFSLVTEDLRFRTLEGVNWPAASLQLGRTAPPGSQNETLTLKAQRLDLTALAALASRLPMPTDAHALLAQLQPAGEVSNLAMRWQGRPGEWAQGSYQASGRVVGLAFAGQPSGRMAASGRYPLPGRPGIRGATVDFEAGSQGGRARLSVKDGVLELPDVFEQAELPVQRLEASAAWRVQGERIEVQLDNVRVSNADAEGTAQVRWHTGEQAGQRFPGVLDLTARLTRANATSVHRYLPLTMPAEARRYVREAVLGGQSDQVDFRVRGEVAEAPYEDPGDQGEFRIAARLRKVDMDYVPAFLQSAGEASWPGLRGVSGELVLDRNSFKVTGIQAGLAGAPGARLSQGEVGIADLAGNSVLVASARVQGPAGELLGFVQRSPINRMTDQALARARIGGAAQVGFGLEVPLHDATATKVSGNLQLDGNDVQISPESPLLGGAKGALTFSETGFAVRGGQARLLGGEVRFDGGLRPDARGVARVQFRGQGEVRAEALREAGLGFVSRLFQSASGSAAYTAQLGFRGGAVELQVASNLQGMALSLPAPLGKSAEASLPLRYDNTVLDVAPNGVARTDRLAIQLGPVQAPALALHYERDVSGSEARALRGSVTIGAEEGASVALPADGVNAQAQFDQVDLDAWERALSSSTGMDVRGATASASQAVSAGLSYLPTTLALRANRVRVEGRDFHRVVVGGSREGTHWRANVDAEELNGYVEIRQSGSGSAGSIYARLARLTLAPAAASEVEQLLTQPSSVPALDIMVEDLSLAGRRLGRAEIEAFNRGGPARSAEWRLTKLRLGVPEARLSATGNWAALGAQVDGGLPAQRRTVLNFTLDVDDSGQLLTRFGREGVVRGGKGRIEGQIGWVGSPLSIDYPSLSGQIRADFERGQFLKADPGVARLLGVLSLQALPRRLALDFRDVFSEGFAFDFVRGDARISQGVLSTNNLQMKGVNAAVLMEGSADLAREQQDIKVVVVPEINAGTASLIATAINPAIGIGSFLAQFLLRQPLQSATTQQFQITGSWADPQVERIDRPSPEPTSPRDPSRGTLQ
ncbi:YhdP family protein [Hydrogenophaga sp.]|uniref:YhdP family protein n=1 Tax=Hydrogenophaga sp. TaxID=1904254 RepID=UPI002630C511|nr:YhdP family protein [Hydrogenophaga sp.]